MGQVVKKMLLLKIIGTFRKKFCLKLQAEVVDGPRRTIKKRGGMIILTIVFTVSASLSTGDNFQSHMLKWRILKK